MQTSEFDALRVELDQKYGYGNWKIRRVSMNKGRNKTKESIPSLTITEELKVLGLNPGDLVIVAIDQENKAIVIYKK